MTITSLTTYDSKTKIVVFIDDKRMKVNASDKSYLSLNYFEHANVHDTHHDEWCGYTNEKNKREIIQANKI